jgi:hypothetical protein
MVRTPALPVWKPADDEDEDERLGAENTSHANSANKVQYLPTDEGAR